MNLSILLILGIVIGCLLAGKNLIHYFQLESYQFPGYFRTLRRNLLKAVLPGFCMMVLLIVTVMLSIAASPQISWVHYVFDAAILIAGGWLIGRSFPKRTPRKLLCLRHGSNGFTLFRWLC